MKLQWHFQFGSYYQKKHWDEREKIGWDVEECHWASLIATVKFPAALNTQDKLAPVFVLPTSFYWHKATQTGT